MFSLSKFQFEIELLDNNAPTGFWGTRLRGGYGDVLKHELCLFPEVDHCENCELFANRDCDFPYLFKPHSHLYPGLPPGRPLGSKSNLPAPFVLSVPFEIDSQLKRGSRLVFEFVGLGRTHERSLRVIDSFGKLGLQGLDVKTERGHLDKARFQLVDVKDLLAGGRSLHSLGNFGQPQVLDILDLIKTIRPQNNVTELIIEFITPVTIYHREYPGLPRSRKNNRGQTARGLRDFYDLIKLVSNRVSGIWQVFGDDWIGQADFFRWRNALLKESKQITIEDIELKRKTFYRYSKGEQMPLPMDGFVGAIKATGDFSNLLEILLIGEILHIGESTAYGFGQYKLVF